MLFRPEHKGAVYIKGPSAYGFSGRIQYIGLEFQSLGLLWRLLVA